MHAPVLSLLLALLALPQWLSAGGFRASETRTWHARSQAVCENNAWMMTGVNLLAQGPLPPEGAQRSAPPPPLKKEQAGPKPPQAQNTPEERREAFLREQERIRAEYDALPEAEVLTRLEAREQTSQSRRSVMAQRFRAFQALERRLRAGQLSQDNVDRLIELAQLEFEVYESDMPTVLALRLLGETGDVTALRLLVDRVDTRVEKPTFRGGWHEGVLAALPAYEGLRRAGDQAIGPILERAGTVTDDQWKLMLSVLKSFDRRTPAVRQAMETLLEVTDDEVARERLEAFLATPEPRRPEPEEQAGEPVALRGD